MFSNIKPGARFYFDGSIWEKRDDGLGADLADRRGNISFMCGRRRIRDFGDETLASPL